MSMADDIRTHVIECHLLPASRRGAERITLRAGDIHSELRLRSRMPAVCSAMGGKKLTEQHAVILEKRTGPKNGSNVFFTYKINNIAAAQRAEPVTVPAQTPKTLKPRSVSSGDDVSNTSSLAKKPRFEGSRKSLFLVSCVKSKLDRPAFAKDIYTSNFFNLARKLVEKNRADWRILSAKYGLLDPDRLIQPYELTLNAMTIADRRLWAAQVWHDLSPLISNYQRVVVLAGLPYREFLIGELKRSSAEIEIPMEGLRQGEQLAWLSQQ